MPLPTIIPTHGCIIANDQKKDIPKSPAIYRMAADFELTGGARADIMLSALA